MWISAQIASHRLSIAVGRTEFTAGTNAKVVAADRAAAPVVASHLQMLLSTASAGSVGTGLSAPVDGSPSNDMLGWVFVVGGAAAAAAGGVGLRRRAVLSR